MVARVVRTVIGFLPFAGKPMNVASTKAAGTKIRLQIIGQKILAHLSPEAGDLRVHWLASTSREPCHRSKKQRPRTKEHAYIQRCYYVSRPHLATEPSRRRRHLTYMGSPKPISKGRSERHTATVVPNGYLWRETTYASLSTIARAITGTAWNCPRFFGELYA
jgi:hypothetical protein